MLLTALALSASLQFDCPPAIDTRQQLLSQPRGWQAVARNNQGEAGQTLSHRLDNLALFNGDPGELASSNRTMVTMTRLTTGVWTAAIRDHFIWSATMGAQPSPCSRRSPRASTTAASTRPTMTSCAD